MIPQTIVDALQARIASLEKENEELARSLQRTENARLVLMGYYERHKARIRKLENDLANAAA